MFVSSGIEVLGADIIGHKGLVEIKTKELFDGLNVFALVEATDGVFSSGGRQATAGDGEVIGEEAHHLGEFALSWLCFVFRWHVSGIENIEDVLPVLSVFVVRNNPVDGIEADIALLLPFTMTFHAILFEKGLNGVAMNRARFGGSQTRRHQKE